MPDEEGEYGSSSSEEETGSGSSSSSSSSSSGSGSSSSDDSSSESGSHDVTDEEADYEEAMRLKLEITGAGGSDSEEDYPAAAAASQDEQPEDPKAFEIVGWGNTDGPLEDGLEAAETTPAPLENLAAGDGTAAKARASPAEAASDVAARAIAPQAHGKGTDPALDSAGHASGEAEASIKPGDTESGTDAVRVSSDVAGQRAAGDGVAAKRTGTMGLESNTPANTLHRQSGSPGVQHAQQASLGKLSDKKSEKRQLPFDPKAPAKKPEIPRQRAKQPSKAEPSDQLGTNTSAHPSTEPDTLGTFSSMTAKPTSALIKAKVQPRTKKVLVPLEELKSLRPTVDVPRLRCKSPTRSGSPPSAGKLAAPARPLPLCVRQLENGPGTPMREKEGMHDATKKINAHYTELLLSGKLASRKKQDVQSLAHMSAVREATESGLSVYEHELKKISNGMSTLDANFLEPLAPVLRLERTQRLLQASSPKRCA